MRKITVPVAVVVAVLLVAGAASAQTVVNPTGFTFQCSPDHAQAVKCQIAVFSPLVPTDPYHVYDVGLPTPDGANQCAVNVDLGNIPLGTGYFAKSRIWVDPTHLSAWSAAGPPFDRGLTAPGPPTPIRQ